MASWLTRILPSGITGTQRVTPAQTASYNGGTQVAERNKSVKGDPRYAPNSSSVHGAVEGTGENGRHRLDMYM